MKRVLVPALFAFLVLALLVPPALAQAPAPKVTITGLFDQVTSMGRNFYDGRLGRDNDREWYARTRFRPDFSFEVGRVKAVLGLEIDLMYGQGGPNDGGFPGNVSGDAGGSAVVGPGNLEDGCKNNANGCFDLNTDVGGMIEIKWMYTEFPLTGKDSVLPFIPVETMARAGAQPWGTLASYKITYANGDFAGVSARTKFAPNLETQLAFVVVEDELAGGNRTLATARTSRGEDYAITISSEITPFKGLDIKPLYSWFHADGVTAGAARHNVINRKFAGTEGAVAANQGAALGGGNAAGDSTNQENRHTVGIDARWRSGPFGFDPTFYYQFGKRDHQAKKADGSIGRVEADMSSWLVDLIGSFRLGPLLLEARGIYTPGNEARDNLARSVRYYQPLSMDGSFYAGWSELMGGSGIDYFNGSLLTNMPRFIGYDRYGRAQIGLRATYSITPAFSVQGVVSPTWTAEKVDTDTNAAPGLATSSITRTTVSDQSWVEGDSRYIGTEVNLGFTWRFAPNTALDLRGGYLFAGSALDTAECLGGAANSCAGGTVEKRDANDAYSLAMRVRFAF
jgi:hypothetical protein